MSNENSAIDKIGYFLYGQGGLRHSGALGDTVMKMFFSFLLSLASVPALAGDTTPPSTNEFRSVSVAYDAYAFVKGGDGGCIETEAFVQATRRLERINDGEWTTSVFVFVNNMTRRNVCTNTLEFNAFGGGPVEKFWHNEGGASVKANVQVNDQVSGNRVPIWINLAWNPFGVRTDENSEVKHTYPEGFYDITNNRRTDIVSALSGSLSDGAFEYAQNYLSATWAQTKTKFFTNAAVQ